MHLFAVKGNERTDMKKTLFCVGLAMGMAGCLSAPFQPPSGLVAVTKAPLSTEGNWEVGPRRGEASSTSVLGLYASGDCSIAAAARNGGLKKIGHVDYEYVNVVGIWQQATVIVYGE